MIAYGTLEKLFEGDDCQDWADLTEDQLDWPVAKKTFSKQGRLVLTDKNCKFFEICSAPICPNEPDGLNSNYRD